MATQQEQWFPSTGLFAPVIGTKVFLAQNVVPPGNNGYRCFTTQGKILYDPLCDDFGPMNMSSIFQFITILQEEIDLYPLSKIAYLVAPGRRALTNAVFLLGAYLMLKLNYSLQEISDIFEWLHDSIITPFRDATFSPPDFDLKLVDCWQGLFRGKAVGWVRFPLDANATWGRIDQEEYDQYGDPLNADLHEVVPGRFVAFRGPQDLGSKKYFDDREGYRHFSPEHYVAIFKNIGVTTVIRLNERQYDGAAFSARGISCFDLEFDDCTVPPPHIVKAFIKIVDGAGGPVAVHCKAGLGRTGTLIALYMMRNLGFTAREAMGWLRIMRPGSVIGQQQHYLVHVESLIQACEPRPGRGGPPQLPPLAGLPPVTEARRVQSAAAATAAAAAAAAAAVQVEGAMRRRSSLALRLAVDPAQRAAAAAAASSVAAAACSGRERLPAIANGVSTPRPAAAAAAADTGGVTRRPAPAGPPATLPSPGQGCCVSEGRRGVTLPFGSGSAALQPGQAALVLGPPMGVVAECVK